MLKLVPKHVQVAYFGNQGMGDDPRWSFFQVPENQKKFYYRKNGENLEKLGQYTDLMVTSHPNSNLGSRFITYIVYFDKTPKRWFHAEMDDDLYYTDEPLSDSELDYSNNPDIKSIVNGYGGRRKTKRYRKSKKSRKSKKYKKSRKYYK